MLSDDELAAPKTYRELIQFYLIDYKTPLGKLIDIVIIFLNLLICAIFVIDTYPISDELRSLLWNIEVVTIFFFVIEYLARLYGAPDRGRYVVGIYSIMDLVAIMPTLLQLVLPIFGAAIDIRFLKTIPKASGWAVTRQVSTGPSTRISTPASWAHSSSSATTR